MLRSVEPSAEVRLATAEMQGSAGPGAASVEILRGFAAVRSAEPEISALLTRTGQADNPLLRPEFFLGRVQLFPGNRPVVLLVRSSDRLEGAVYLFEKIFMGIPTGYLRGFDHLTGESSVIAKEEARSSVLQHALHQLFLKTRARVAWATVNGIRAASPANSISKLDQLRIESSSIGRQHRLRLSESFAATLSRFGQHTRRNLRYYRRRAEKELSAVFEPELNVDESVQAMQQLSEPSFQPFRQSLAEWRKMNNLLRTQPGYFAMGLRAHGKWISFLVGMRSGQQTYVLLQMNHSQYAKYSLSTVLRSYFFEHEIELGQSEIKFVNGTCALFQRCCEPDSCLTISASRGIGAFIISNWIAPWRSAPDHALNMRRWTQKPAERAAAGPAQSLVRTRS